MRKDLRTVTDFVRLHETLAPETVLRAVERLTSKPRAKKDRSPGRMKPTSAQFGRQTKAIRLLVRNIAGDACERCGLHILPAEGHLHHTLGGSGKRRQLQAVETCAWLCPRCHVVMHQEPHLLREFREKLKVIRATKETA